jgi:hydrogenase maturation protein HypF
MAEHSLQDIVAVICDGFGFGFRGEAYGGEIFVCHGFQARRAAHLEEQPMVGGDLAARYPARMVAGILKDEPGIEGWLKMAALHLPHRESEIAIIMHQLDRKDFIWTSSCGRVLDSIAAILGISYERTYEGEPAMKLEAHSTGGVDRLDMKPVIDGELIRTTQIVRAIFDNRGKIAVQDLAFSAHSYLARALADVAIKLARENSIQTVGFSGGVALNELISLMIQKIVSEAGLRYVSNALVPPGDGGLSFGQAYLASLQ